MPARCKLFIHSKNWWIYFTLISLPLRLLRCNSCNWFRYLLQCNDFGQLCEIFPVPVAATTLELRSHNGHHRAASGVNDMVATLADHNKGLVVHDLNMSHQKFPRSGLALDSPSLIVRHLILSLALSLSLTRSHGVIIESAGTPRRGVEFAVSDNLIICFASNVARTFVGPPLCLLMGQLAMGFRFLVGCKQRPLPFVCAKNIYDIILFPYTWLLFLPLFFSTVLVWPPQSVFQSKNNRASFAMSIKVGC